MLMKCFAEAGKRGKWIKEEWNEREGDAGDPDERCGERDREDESEIRERIIRNKRGR